jgi:hypothetical protein
MREQAQTPTPHRSIGCHQQRVCIDAVRSNRQLRDIRQQVREQDLLRRQLHEWQEQRRPSHAVGTGRHEDVLYSRLHFRVVGCGDDSCVLGVLSAGSAVLRRNGKRSSVCSQTVCVLPERPPSVRPDPVRATQCPPRTSGRPRHRGRDVAISSVKFQARRLRSNAGGALSRGEL